MSMKRDEGTMFGVVTVELGSPDAMIRTDLLLRFRGGYR